MSKFLLYRNKDVLTIFRVSRMRKWLISESRGCANTSDVYVRLFSELVKNSYEFEGFTIDDTDMFQKLNVCQSMYCRMVSTLTLPLHASVICDILLASNNDKEDFLKVKSSIYSIVCDYSINFNRLQRVVYSGRLNDELLRLFAELYLRLADALWVFDCYHCACNAILLRECLYYDIPPIILHYENKDEYDKILESKRGDRVTKLVEFFKTEQKSTAKFLKSL